MSKTLEASCVAGVVTVGALPITGAQILSEGISASNGVLIIDEDKTYYIAKISPDLKTSLQKISTALGKIATVLTTLDTSAFLIGAVGAVPSPPLSAVTIAQLSAVKVEIDLLAETLK